MGGPFAARASKAHENGELLATGDGPPMGGAFPTRLWQPGDAVHDLHVIPLGDSDLAEEGDFHVGIGLYDLNTGERLQAMQAGQTLQNHVVLVSAQR